MKSEASSGTVDRCLLIAAPSSGSGKTTITLGLLRALRRRGQNIYGAKAGPDFIDPGFHSLASGAQCGNLDPWGMQPARLGNLLSRSDGSLCLIEGMMGLFDGAADGSGSAATLAEIGSVPIVLVVDAAKQSHSIAALVRGFRDHDQSIDLVGVILNKVGSPRHEAMLRSALEAVDVTVLGAVPRDEKLVIPERHLGLVQALENKDIEQFIDAVADTVEQSCDLDTLTQLFRVSSAKSSVPVGLAKLGNHIAIARDEAFSFCYAHLITDWKLEGAEVSYFSPLKNEAPSGNADAVYLPGGYPELHAEHLAAANTFISGMRHAQQRGACIYGECGGYMVLGNGITDKAGIRHKMVGLLPLETSFAKRKLHLGYRKLTAENFELGDALTAHEFHYTTATEEKGEPLFKAKDALGTDLGPAGLKLGNVMGSYMHIIDRQN